ncbi:MAG: NAD(P)-dependent oxidoreductase [Promethearchaeota archaeon]
MEKLNPDDNRNLNKAKIGWIGTGVMGAPMAQHLIESNFSLNVFTRSKYKAQSLIEAGARWCESPQKVAQQSEIIFTMVGFPHDVEDVYFSNSGIFQGIKKGSIVVDMTTSEPQLAQKISESAHQNASLSLDAPVSGGDIGARNATLAIMVGGDRDAFDRILPIFQIIGQNIKYMGAAGAGQHTKMSNQILIASTMVGVVESLLYAYKAGNDLGEVIEVIGKGAAASWSINNLGRRIVKDDFDPGFFIKHFVKDMGIALKEAQHMKLSLPSLALAYQFYMSAMAFGWENLGTQALYKVFQKMNDIE